MTKYVCTCGASHTGNEWDQRTADHYGNGCVSIDDGDSVVYHCTFVCPSCEKELDGNEIEVVEE